MIYGSDRKEHRYQLAIEEQTQSGRRGNDTEVNGTSG